MSEEEIRQTFWIAQPGNVDNGSKCEQEREKDLSQAGPGRNLGCKN